MADGSNPFATAIDIVDTPLVYIIIVNWNGWRDTLECLESVFRSDYPNYRVIVCDNGSADESLKMIRIWAEGGYSVAGTASNLRGLSDPPVQKPVTYVEYDRGKGERGGDSDVPLTLIRTGANLGFAGGNNVGLRYALARGDFGYVWLLNNDTVVKADSLTHLCARMQMTPEAGICGSTLLYYDHPDTVQGLGGAKYNRLFGIARPIGFLAKYLHPPDREQVEMKMSYVIGASMLVTRRFLEEVGVMNEEYFLFFEEIDWVVRAGRRFKLAYAPESIIYHKEGRSAGIHHDPARQSNKADYFLTRNKILLTRRFFPWALPTVYLGLLVTILNRLRRGQVERVGMILDIMLHPDKQISNCRG